LNSLLAWIGEIPQVLSLARGKGNNSLFSLLNKQVYADFMWEISK
jgi:hypothetical protein